MLRYLFRLTAKSIRLSYPAIRYLGRVTGQEERAEEIIEVSEENIQRSLAVFDIEEDE